MKKSIDLFLIVFLKLSIMNMLMATSLHVGNGHPYPDLEAAAQDATPGDSIIIHGGTHSGGQYVEDLQGTADAWIVITAAPGETVIYDGGSNAWQFTDGAFLEIRDIIFQHQTGNGLNFDDGGTYATPTHHIRFHDCTFRDMNATGNNDLLKLSGMDSFEVTNCLFLNGAAGGSGIDMVGCHDGVVSETHFENLGSNSIQLKGGTSNIRIEGNFFKNGGQRALNLGGSTDLQFFRPIDAPYEAAELKVYSNVFIGSLAPIAFVGSIHCEVINNTFYKPTKWVMRILQETVDPNRFPPCGLNTYRNNIIYMDEQVQIDVNIGSNTAPETFTFSNNLWYHEDDLSWPGPDLPAPDPDHIVGQDPLFTNAGAEDFSIENISPAIGQGFTVANPVLDFNGQAFNNPPSIGAFEGGVINGTWPVEEKIEPIFLFPNPTKENIYFVLPVESEATHTFRISDTHGKIFLTDVLENYGYAKAKLHVSSLPPGQYILIYSCKGKNIAGKFVKVE